MISIPSFAKINLGLKIGPARPDGFHELRTVYQTLALHDMVRVGIEWGSGIEIRCSDPRVPLDETNTCYKVAERVLAAISGVGAEEPQVPRLARDDKGKGRANGATEAAPLQNQACTALQQKIAIEIEKHLPVQGGMGAASSNGVAAMLGLERALGIALPMENKLRIAAEVGSDLPLFLIGGTVLGEGRGEQVSPLPDLSALPVVVVTPSMGVSTPKAFAQWDQRATRMKQLTGADAAGTIKKFSASVSDWLSQSSNPQAALPASPVLGLDRVESVPASGVPAFGGDRAETLLLDLVRAGIENDFEHVVFPEYPDLHEVKELLLREGARYASLSGSGSTLYGLFASRKEAESAAQRLSAAGHAAVATTTLTRNQYWKAVGRE